jgi:Ca2+-binding EF-hand superfamily protein
MMVLMEYMRQKNMRLVDLFTRLDADGSKSLSRKEFKDGLLVSHRNKTQFRMSSFSLKEVNIPLSGKGLNKLLDNLDRDGDGEVDFA